MRPLLAETETEPKPAETEADPLGCARPCMPDELWRDVPTIWMRCMTLMSASAAVSSASPSTAQSVSMRSVSEALRPFGRAAGRRALRILDGDLGERDGDLRAGVANVE